MKIPTLILGVAATVLALTLYLSHRIAVQSELANIVAQQRAQLEVRVMELERMYAALEASSSEPAADIGLPAASADAMDISADISAKALVNEDIEGAASADAANPFGQMAKLFDDPQRRQAMVERRAASMYISYFGMDRELGLVDGQGGQLMQLLAEHQMQDMQAMMQGRSKDSQTRRSESEDRQRTQETELKGLLGYDKYQQYKAYQESMPERDQLRDLRGLLDGDHTLRKDQEQQLMTIMGEERKRSSSELASLQTNSSIDAAAPGRFSQENRRIREESNRRVLERAGGVLTQEQLKRFTELRDQESAMRRAVRPQESQT